MMCEWVSTKPHTEPSSNWRGSTLPSASSVSSGNVAQPSASVSVISAASSTSAVVPAEVRYPSVRGWYIT